MSLCCNVKLSCDRPGCGSANSCANRPSIEQAPPVPGARISRIRTVSTTSEVSGLLREGAAVAIGVSGGKDSQAATMALFDYLDRIGHAGPRLLIHADLGLVEWKDSLPVCERLARTLGTELVVVRHKQGGLMERWERRWQSNVERYRNLSTVTLVPCWSTPALRFCTSEQKTSQIHAQLKRRFKGLPIISVTGVRRQESRRRAKVAIADFNVASGIWTWRPIADWSEDEVFSSLEAWGVELHPAYRQFGMSRVSCRFCIMSSHADLVAATWQEETHELYRRMVGLESRSSFAFQGNRWLADIAPHLLDSDMRAAIAQAKERAQLRMEAERRIERSMLYVKGWPTRMLNDAEADLLMDVRSTISGMLGLNALYLDRTSIHQRYAELIEIRERRTAA